MRVAVFDDPVFREHDSGPGHPERPERVDAVRRGIAAAGLDARVAWLPTRDWQYCIDVEVLALAIARATSVARGGITKQLTIKVALCL